MKAGVTLIGDKELQAKFGALPEKLQRKGLRKGVTKAGRGVVKEAKKEAPKETKLLSQSLGQRVFSFRDKTGIGAVIGVRKDFKKAVVRAKRGGFRKARKKELGTAKTYRNPAKYLHLVILGTKHSRPNNFLLRAAMRTRGQSIRIISQEARQQLQRETASKT